MNDDLKKFLNKIHKGDCLEILKQIPDNSVDLIFADPPYNLQLKNPLFRPNQTMVNAVNDSWDKFGSFSEYDNFSNAWLLECKRVLKKTGTIWVIGSYHNIFRIGYIMQNLGYWILNDIIWIKSNPMPNFKGTRFNNAHETLIWATKEEGGKYTFNYKSMKSFNDDKQMRSDWYIPICNGNERIKVNGKKAHSTQKPEALLYRILLSSSKPNDIVLDPFMGSGTTGAMAKKLGRNYIGIEKDAFYIGIANERIKQTKMLADKDLSMTIEEKKPKVPFGNLLESSLIKAGETLYSENEKELAIILANATILWKKQCGSIHKISAKILNKSTNNGWTFWYVKRANKLKSIDDLRYEYLIKNSKI